MISLKTVGAFAVIVGCFAVVYPRFLHPLVLRAFGIQSATGKEDDTHYPPHMQHSNPSLMDRKPPPMPHDPKDIRQHMRPGPHPGMRAAAEMQKQQAGTGRGMMGIVLPMYAIGICVYLVYTLFKVFNKRGKCSDPYSPAPATVPASTATKRRGDPDDVTRDRLGFPKGMRGYEAEQPGFEDGEVQRFLRQKQQERELEDLLVKMDDTRNVSEDEMQALQKRLEETEAQMTRILQAMQTMQSRTGTASGEGEGGEGEGEGTASGGDRAAAGGGSGVSDTGSPAARVETLGTTAPSASSSQESQKESPDAESRASSPDTDSYEMVKKTASAATDLSPASPVSSHSSFEQIQKAAGGSGPEVGGGGGGEETEEDGGCEELIPDQEEEELPSSVRHRKTGHAEED